MCVFVKGGFFVVVNVLKCFDGSLGIRCQWSDHNFLNTPCGIMDQFVSALAQKNATLLVDCRSNAYEPVPLDDPDIVFVVANSGIRHRNADGAYAERVRQCGEAVEAVSILVLFFVFGVCVGDGFKGEACTSSLLHNAVVDPIQGGVATSQNSPHYSALRVPYNV